MAVVRAPGSGSVFSSSADCAIAPVNSNEHVSSCSWPAERGHRQPLHNQPATRPASSRRAAIDRLLAIVTLSTLSLCSCRSPGPSTEEEGWLYRTNGDRLFQAFPNNKMSLSTIDSLQVCRVRRAERSEGPRHLQVLLDRLVYKLLCNMCSHNSCQLRGSGVVLGFKVVCLVELQPFKPD
jgi:hypothetical protein